MKRAATAFALLMSLWTAPANASPLEGVWTGAYICGQGETGVRLTIEDGAAPNELIATFRFLPVETNPDVPDGVFIMRGAYEPSGAVALRGDHWIVRPVDYEMVDLIGRVERDASGDAVMQGQVHFPPAPELCTIFRMTQAK